MKQGPTYGSLAVDVERELVSDLVFGLSLVDGRRQCPFSRWGSHHKLVDWHKVRFNFPGVYFNTIWSPVQAGRYTGYQTPRRVRALEHQVALPEQLTLFLKLGTT